MPKAMNSTRLILVISALAACLAAAAFYFRKGSEAPFVASSSSRDAVVIPGTPSWEQIDDARRDGWDSEVFAAKASQQLNALGKLIVRSEEIKATDVEALVTEDFSCGELRPRNLEMVFQDQVLRVEREEAADEPVKEETPGTGRGPGRLSDALNGLAAPFRQAKEARFEFKVVDVKKSADSVTTRQQLAISGRTAEGCLEQHSVWTTQWTQEAEGAPPKLRAVRAQGFEQVRRLTALPLFSDCTEAVLGKNPSWGKQLLLGLNHWLERIQDNRFFDLLGTPGLAVGDVNGDDLDDLYVCQEGGLPNLLFVQNADGTASDVSDTSVANWIESSRSALLVDLDNDGSQDLVVTILGNLVLHKGDGKGHFALKAVLPTSQDTMSLSAADYDQDGDLDLYLCAYKQDDLSQDAGVLSIGASGDFVYHDAQNGAKNILLRNDGVKDGEWRFSDVTVEVGLDVNNRRFSFAAAWEDFDNDGDQDLYVANDFGRNVLYRNDSVKGGQARFVEVAGSTGAEDSASGMSVAWGDFDHDGWMDLYVSNMFSAAGSRITSQPKFKADATEEVKTRLQRFARGNTLLKNQDGRAFNDISEAAGVTMGRWAWSSNFLDIQNDGWEDLVVANGYVTTEDTGDL